MPVPDPLRARGWLGLPVVLAFVAGVLAGLAHVLLGAVPFLFPVLLAIVALAVVAYLGLAFVMLVSVIARARIGRGMVIAFALTTACIVVGAAAAWTSAFGTSPSWAPGGATTRVEFARTPGGAGMLGVLALFGAITGGFVGGGIAIPLAVARSTAKGERST